MKKLLWSIALICALTGCGEEGSEINVPDTIDRTDLTIAGNIYNPSAGKVLYRDAGEITFPSITSIDERIDDITQGQMIEVSTAIQNTGIEDLTELSYIITVEDAHYFTPEVWSCKQCFPYGEGEACNTVTEFVGGDIHNAHPTPDMSSCEGTPAISGYCVDPFPDGVDCKSPSWRVDYELPGDGLWKAYGNIDVLDSGGNYSTTVGYSNSNIDVRTDHIAQWIVKDNTGVVIKSKEYIFNVLAQ